MLDVSSLIEFLLKLLRDDAAQAEFVRDPQTALAQAGLSGVTTQDICDAQPVLADTTGVVVHHPPAHHHDPVHQIKHVINTHTVDKQLIVKHDAPQYNTYNEYNQHYSYTDNSIHADTAIVDSFNQDNDGVDNKGGVIDHSNVANGDQTDVGNSQETTVLDDSLNTDAHHDTAIVDSGNDSSDNSTAVANSGNDSSSHTHADVNGSFDTDNSVHVGVPAADDAATALHAADVSV
jgi:hypothetical protein